MPHAPSLPLSDRVFARVDRFEVECPACGQLIGQSLRRVGIPGQVARPSGAS